MSSAARNTRAESFAARLPEHQAASRLAFGEPGPARLVWVRRVMLPDVLHRLLDRQRPRTVADTQVEDRLLLVFHVDGMVARLRGDLADVLPVDLTEVDARKRGGSGLAEIAGEEVVQVQLEPVAVLVLERAVVRGETDQRTGVVDAVRQIKRWPVGCLR